MVALWSRRVVRVRRDGEQAGSRRQPSGARTSRNRITNTMSSTNLSYAHGASYVPLLGETIGENLRRTVERFGGP